MSWSISPAGDLPPLDCFVHRLQADDTGIENVLAPVFFTKAADDPARRCRIPVRVFEGWEHELEIPALECLERKRLEAGKRIDADLLELLPVQGHFNANTPLALRKFDEGSSGPILPIE